MQVASHPDKVIRRFCLGGVVRFEVAIYSIEAVKENNNKLIITKTNNTMDQTTIFYYIGIFAFFGVLLLLTYFMMRKHGAHKAQSTDDGVQMTEEYGEPIEVIMPAFSVTLRNFAPVELYHDVIIQDNIRIARDDIECVTFNNYAPAELPNEYQVIVKSADYPHKIITVPVGDDLHYASLLVERIREIYAGEMGKMKVKTEK